MKLLKSLWVLAMSILLLACGEGSSIEDEIKDKLEDAIEMPQIGDLTAGGIVFYIAETPTDLDGDGDLDTGLVCATEDQSSGVQWHNVNFISTGAEATSVGSGAINTAMIIAAQGEGTYAASVARAHNGGGFDDWFLPSKDELNLMYLNLKTKDLGDFSGTVYWTSSEAFLDSAWAQGFSFRGYDNFGTSSINNVRAVRAF